MNIKSVDNSMSMHSAPKEQLFKKSNSAKVSALILGSVLAGAEFLDINKDGSFVESVKKFKPSSGKVNPIVSFLCSTAVLVLPLLIFGTVLDEWVNDIRNEKNKKLDKLV